MSRAKHRPTIAALLDYVGGPYQTDVRIAFEQSARAKDVDLILVFGQRLDAPADTERVHNRVFDQLGPERIDGVCVVSSVIANFCDDARLREFCERYAGLPISSIGRPVDGVPSVVVDNQRGMNRIVRHLIDVHERRRIAYIGGPAESSEAQDRAAGYRMALRESGVPFDERLVLEGQFTHASGQAAMAQLLAGEAGLDAVVVANDEMAFGALEVLKQRGIAVPDVVALTGFDDTLNAAYSSPSLSTVRQPLRMLAARGLEIVLDQIAGRSPPQHSMVQVELVRRASCGCGEGLALPTGVVIDEQLPEYRERLESALFQCVILPSDELADWPQRLLTALDEAPATRDTRFLATLKSVLDAAAGQGVNVDEFHRAILLLRSVAVARGERAAALEDLWHRSRTLVAASALRAQATLRVSLEQATQRLGWSGERITTSLSRPVLATMLSEELPNFQLRDAAVSLFPDATCTKLQSLVALKDGRPLPDRSDAFEPKRLAPDAFFEIERQRIMVMLPVRFEREFLGVALLESGSDTPTYSYLATLIGAALKSSELHHEVIRGIDARKQLEAEQLEQQARLAAQIQTALAPRNVRLEGLEIATEMRAAAEVGGDYFDLIPTQDGGWFSIGDVTGHGLAAGLISLMLQSQVSVLANAMPSATPAEVVGAMNGVLRNNIRQRLGRDDHATLVVLRYSRSGHIVFAGSHDPLIVCRAATRRAEIIETHGVWVGALVNIDDMTRDSEFRLLDGDVLVLHTDGITEACNAHRQQFGLERLCASIEARFGQSSQAIVDGVFVDVNAWTTSHHDDMSLVVARYSAPAR